MLSAERLAEIESAAEKMAGNLDVKAAVAELVAEVRRVASKRVHVATLDQAEIAMKFLDYEAKLSPPTDDAPDEAEEVRKIACETVARFLRGS